MKQQLNLRSDKRLEKVWSIKEVFEYIINNSYDLGEEISNKNLPTAEGFIWVTDYGTINYSREQPEWDEEIGEYYDEHKEIIDDIDGIFAFDSKMAILELTWR